MTQYRELHPPTEAFQNLNGAAIPRWLMPLITHIHQDISTIVLTVTKLDSTTLIINTGEWVVKDGQTNAILRFTNANFVLAYEPIV